MQQPLTNVIVTLLVLALSGCAANLYGTVLPQGNGTYQLVEKAQSERDAFKMAQRDAEATCKRYSDSRSFITIEHSSEDVGLKLEKGKGTAKDIASSVVEFAGRLRNDENYRVEMTFRCA